MYEVKVSDSSIQNGDHYYDITPRIGTHITTLSATPTLRPATRPAVKQKSSSWTSSHSTNAIGSSQLKKGGSTPKKNTKIEIA